jgi:serine/threonine-protein kinase HSL1, negative regulator of Swe1 kinase
MSVQQPPRPPTRRGPLGDATARVNNTRPIPPVSPPEKRLSIPHCQSLGPENLLPAHDYLLITSNPRLSAITKEHKDHNPNRDSQVSSTSTNVSDSRKRKTHIGPWHLGKTLGKGSTARVRMARHAVTGQLAAIKIVQKKNAQLSQAGSLASLDRKDATLISHGDEFRRMPFGIEREVAIMKLIEHPHIMKLYDIWENRTEM